MRGLATLLLSIGLTLAGFAVGISITQPGTDLGQLNAMATCAIGAALLAYGEEKKQ